MYHRERAGQRSVARGPSRGPRAAAQPRFHRHHRPHPGPRDRRGGGVVRHRRRRAAAADRRRPGARGARLEAGRAPGPRPASALVPGVHRPARSQPQLRRPGRDQLRRRLLPRHRDRRPAHRGAGDRGVGRILRRGARRAAAPRPLARGRRRAARRGAGRRGERRLLATRVGRRSRLRRPAPGLGRRRPAAGGGRRRPGRARLPARQRPVGADRRFLRQLHPLRHPQPALRAIRAGRTPGARRVAGAGAGRAGRAAAPPGGGIPRRLSRDARGGAAADPQRPGRRPAGAAVPVRGRRAGVRHRRRERGGAFADARLGARARASGPCRVGRRPRAPGARGALGIAAAGRAGHRLWPALRLGAAGRPRRLRAGRDSAHRARGLGSPRLCVLQPGRAGLGAELRDRALLAPPPRPGGALARARRPRRARVGVAAPVHDRRDRRGGRGRGGGRRAVALVRPAAGGRSRLRDGRPDRGLVAPLRAALPGRADDAALLRAADAGARGRSRRDRRFAVPHRARQRQRRPQRAHEVRGTDARAGARQPVVELGSGHARVLRDAGDPDHARPRLHARRPRRRGAGGHRQRGAGQALLAGPGSARQTAPSDVPIRPGRRSSASPATCATAS